jgi:hypothetical protein
MGWWPRLGRGVSGGALAAAAGVAVLLGGCGGTPQSSPGAPLTLQQVAANLKRTGYRITVFSPHEGALQIDSTHMARGGLSVEYSPQGVQLYGAVYETNASAVRAAIIAHNSDETQPIVRGSLIFTISGSAAQLQRIVKDAGDAG